MTFIPTPFADNKKVYYHQPPPSLLLGELTKVLYITVWQRYHKEETNKLASQQGPASQLNTLQLIQKQELRRMHTTKSITPLQREKATELNLTKRLGRSVHQAKTLATLKPDPLSVRTDQPIEPVTAKVESLARNNPIYATWYYTGRKVYSGSPMAHSL
jgi:hypothetical protein